MTKPLPVLSIQEAVVELSILRSLEGYKLDNISHLEAVIDFLKKLLPKEAAK